jgi:hypothetical protein
MLGSRKPSEKGRTKVPLLSVLQRLRDGVISLVLESPFWAFVCLLAGLVVVKCGVGAYPANFLGLKIALAFPGRPALDAYSQYAMSSPLGPILAKALGATTLRSYAALHAVVLLVGMTALIYAVRQRRGERTARLVALSFACTPMPMVLLGWLGSYDVFTFLLASFLVLMDGPLIVALLSFALGLAHFEQGLLIAMALLFIRQPASIARWKPWISMLGGLVVGKLSLWLYLNAIGIRFGRFLWLASQTQDADLGLSRFVGHLGVLSYSLLGGGWLLVGFVCLAPGRRWPEMRRVVLTLAAFLIPMYFTSWPVVMQVVFWVEERATADTIWAYTALGVGAFTLPSRLVWDGTIISPSLDNVLEWLAVAF